MARIDYCEFGNSRPFRVRIINRLNDNYDHFYVKKADASRIYGLELEDLLSPNRVTFMVDKDTLIEEHIAGVPGDDFMKKYLDDSDFNQIRIAKEFVKFNERCFIRLLGDMRSYNYVVDITPDFEEVQYRVRAIDFDQQCFEGKLKVYRPQFFKENFNMVDLVSTHLKEESIEQYKVEERSIIAKRFKSTADRIEELIEIAEKDQISNTENIVRLREEIYEITHDMAIRKCATMGEILKAVLDFVIRNYEDMSAIR